MSEVRQAAWMRRCRSTAEVAGWRVLLCVAERGPAQNAIRPSRPLGTLLQHIQHLPLDINGDDPPIRSNHPRQGALEPLPVQHLI